MAEAQAIAVAHSGSPFISVYEWDEGIGAKYADPAALPAALGRGVAFSPDGSVVALAYNSGPAITAYAWADGFGPKYADPATAPAGVGTAVAFSPDGSAVAVSSSQSPGVSAYPWSDGFGSKYADPASPPTDSAYGIAFSPDGAAIAVAHASSPYVSVYPWENGFGAKYANPATLPASTGRGVAFSPDGATLAVAHFDSPRVSIYPWSNGFGAKYANPTTLPAGNGLDIAFSPDGAAIAVAHVNSPYVSVYPWENGFGAKYANPATLPNFTGDGVAFSPDGTAIAVAHSGTPYVSIYPWSNGFGAKYANPTTLPAGDGWAVAFSRFFIDAPPTIVAGPTVTYLRGDSTHEFSSPVELTFTAVDDTATGSNELGWEIWTGAGRTGTLVASGTCTSGSPTSVLIPYDAPGLAVGVNTLYLTVDDGALVSDDVPFEILRRIGAQKTVALVWHTGGRVTKSLDLRWHTGGRAMRTVDLIWSVEPSERRITRALVTSPVRYEFRYELRDRNNQFIRDVTSAFDGPTSIDLNNDRSTLRTARFRIRPRYGIDPLRDYVAIYQDVLVDGNYWQEIPLGLYALHAPKRTYAVTHELWDVEASDLTVRLMESTTTETFVVEASENYIGAVRTILDNLGIRHALPSHDAVLTADRKWPAGTPWLQVVNDLLNAINLYTLWFRVDGVATTRARDSLAERTPDLVLTDTNGLMLADPISVEDELTRLANQVVVVVDNPDHQPMSAVATNADRDWPISTVQLGYTRTKVLTRQSAPNVATLQAIAQAELEAAASLYQRATLTTAFDGRRDAHEVYELTDADLGERQRWWCRSWTAELTTPATMKHNLGRVQRVVAS